MIERDQSSFDGSQEKEIEGFSTPGQQVNRDKTQLHEAFIVSFRFYTIRRDHKFLVLPQLNSHSERFCVSDDFSCFGLEVRSRIKSGTANPVGVPPAWENTPAACKNLPAVPGQTGRRERQKTSLRGESAKKSGANAVRDGGTNRVPRTVTSKALQKKPR